MYCIKMRGCVTIMNKVRYLTMMTIVTALMLWEEAPWIDLEHWSSSWGKRNHLMGYVKLGERTFI
jgi:hypothetical protein